MHVVTVKQRNKLSSEELAIDTLYERAQVFACLEKTPDLLSWTKRQHFKRPLALEINENIN